MVYSKSMVHHAKWSPINRETCGSHNVTSATKSNQGQIPRPKTASARKLLVINHLRAVSLSQRRARDSNPQPLAGHHISSVAASHSLTLPAPTLTTYRSEFSVAFNTKAIGCKFGGPRRSDRAKVCWASRRTGCCWAAEIRFGVEPARVRSRRS